ncbi:hypothetical protein D3872_06510 [Massilia cavernae]|uniref:Uncharacterized protein n=1 Tax=Massilia cavernae TaxID=2320864 RepID=A0A418Y570_9BURK|nr:hypothetical protein D3872_06510 [Massilia cavernae]
MTAKDCKSRTIAQPNQQEARSHFLLRSSQNLRCDVVKTSCPALAADQANRRTYEFFKKNLG